LRIIYSHIPNKQLDEANIIEVTALNTVNGPHEDGQTRMTETCGGFNDVIY